jgi:hypothetical protein
MQNVALVEMIVKYHSSQKKIDLFTAENASRIINQNQEDPASFYCLIHFYKRAPAAQ